MKKNYFTFIALLCFHALLQAQVFPVETLQWTGDENNRVNLVIMGDGYTSAEQGKMSTDAAAVVSKIFQTSPYKEYKNYYNVVLVKVVSNQSGASHAHNSSDNACGSQPVATVDNYFGSAFDGGGGNYHRLLVATKGSKINSALASNFPSYDACLIMVNTPYYGGAGGSVAVFSLDGSASEIAIHELGHSFGGLADEYQIEQGEAPNRTANNNPATVKWKNWLNLSGVGIFQNGTSSWYKPVNGTCKMEYLGTNYPFCAVCRESHVNRIHALTKSYDTYSPSNATTLNLSADRGFTINTVLPSPNTLQIVWKLNGTTIAAANNLSAYTLPYSSLVKGGASNTLVATVTDVSSFVKTATPTTYQITWNITANNQAPTVSLTSPTNGSSFAAPATVTLNATASDPDGSISKVDFYNGANLLFSDNASPYAYSWSGVAAGTYVITAKAYDNSNVSTTSNASTITVTSNSGTGDGLTANYFNGMNFETPVYTTKDAVVNVNWGNGSPNAAVNADVFSARWTGQIQPRYTGEYTFYVTSDNGRRLWIGGQLIIDKWIDDWDIEYSGKVTLTAGQKYNFRMDYFENNGGANCKLEWSSPSQAREVIPVSQLYSNPVPSITITAPANNASFNTPANIAFTVNASDNGSVAKVEYYQGAIKLGESTTSPFGFTWSNVAVGNYSLTARATDNIGAVKVSGITSIQVKTPTANVPPTVTLTSPTNGATYNAPATINLAANASDQDGTISKVEFYNGATMLFSDNASPYAFSWSGVAAGTYSITAKAYDNAGGITTSSSASITISNVTSDPCSGLPTYIEANGGYVAGSKVKNAGKQFECREFPYSGWCNGVAWAYAPGSGTYWTDAWYERGNCSARTSESAELESVENISVVPNPATDVVTIVSDQSTLVSIFNAQGIVMQAATEVQANGMLNLSEYPSGVYMLRIDLGSKIVVKKIVKN